MTRFACAALLAAVLTATAIAAQEHGHDRVGPGASGFDVGAPEITDWDGGTHYVAPGDALPPLVPGMTIVLEPGLHLGPWTIDAPGVTLRGDGAVLDGGGAGDALTLRALDVRVEGLEVVRSGPTADLYEPDAAVAILDCHGCAVNDLRAHGVVTGVRIEGSTDVRLARIELVGDGRGPGVTAFAADRLRIWGGSVHGFLDGIYLERSDGSAVQALEVTDSVRYGLHAMLTQRLTLADNTVRGGAIGSVVMYGRDSIVFRNRFLGHRGPMAFGLLLQEERSMHMTDNVFRDNTLGLLVVASPGLVVEAATFDANGVGVLIQRPDVRAADVTNMVVRSSSFTRNAADVAVADGDAALTLAGNAYDRAPRLDLDGDGVVDVPYVATSAFAARAARQPDVTLLAHGPGIALWERLEASVPGVRAASFVDRSARITPPVERAPGAGAGAAALTLVLVLAGALSAYGRRALEAVVDASRGAPSGHERPTRRER